MIHLDEVDLIFSRRGTGGVQYYYYYTALVFHASFPYPKYNRNEGTSSQDGV